MVLPTLVASGLTLVMGRVVSLETSLRGEVLGGTIALLITFVSHMLVIRGWDYDHFPVPDFGGCWRMKRGPARLQGLHAGCQNHKVGHLDLVIRASLQHSFTGTFLSTSP